MDARVHHVKKDPVDPPQPGERRISGFVRAPVRPSAPPAGGGTRRPDWAGSRRVLPGSTSVYVVDPDGYRRCVPNHLTYNRLFRGWQGVVDDPDVLGIAERPPMTTSARLIRGDLSSTVYLFDSGVKGCIPSHSAMDKYWFSWERIEVLKQYFVDTIPNGRPWQ